ncbi:CUB domain-containing protein 1 isoform X1 [Hypanus sabinus]|uniref:CUB domain-containing protein 1 isoform X1 n=1 Tax=Hypanus sabinus TaxID=79690 RepID=UPI0028C3A523|nr:CUB domain-containing protein 1 isoform X1 [Hypanus sabinus]
MLGAAVCLLLLLARAVPTGAGMISVTADQGVTINIRQATGNLSLTECQMCTGEGDCYSEYQILPGDTLFFKFTCSDPEHHFIMEVKKDIAEADDLEDLLPQNLPRLNTTYIWAINVPYNVGVGMSFPQNRLQQMDSGHCPDLVKYTIKGHVRFDDKKEVLVGTFCKNGTIYNLKIQGRTLIALEVPWSTMIDDPGFELYFLSPIKRFSVVDVVLQPSSSVHFMSANWPQGFPNDELMTWTFAVPSNHHANVTVESSTFPSCVKREAGWFFGPSVLSKKLNQFHKKFMLTLQNCDMDSSSATGLTLHFKVEVFTDHGERFEIKLRKEDDALVKFKQLLEDSNGLFCICKFPVASDCASELQLNPGDHLNISFHFQCNVAKDIAVEATRNISCKDQDKCSVKNVDLVLPSEITSLPVLQQTFKWVLEAPPEMTIELAAKRLKLQQLLPGQSCDGNLTYNMSTFCENGARSTVGLFCPGGAMELIQTTDSVSLELLTSDGWGSSDVDISLSFIPRVTEDYIMKVTPEAGSSINLLTPNWELGMPNKLTASWDISILEDHIAELSFLNQSMPHCEHGHVIISVDEQWEHSNLISYRETDALPDSPITLAHRFWLNVSNCEPSSGQLNLVFHMLVKEYEDNMEVLMTCVAAVGGLALIATLVVIVCCLQKRRRQQRQPAVGIYNPSVNTHRPRHQRKFGKTRQENESHIYAVIDEDRVYTDYFNNTQFLPIPEVDVYRPFQGPMGNVLPTLPPPRGTVPKGSNPETVPMVSNDLYTFSVKKADVENNGETVTFLGNGEKDSSS